MASNKNTDGVVVIKKYANRRLYNTGKSSYVTLDDLAQMVRAGEDFVVYDAKSGDDITRSVLTQIIFEEEAKGTNMLPISFLRQLISLYGDTLESVVPGYLEASMEAFTSNQEQMRQTISAGMGANPAMANFEAMARSNMELFGDAMRMFAQFNPAAAAMGAGSAAAKPDDEEPAAASEEKTGSSELSELKEQLAAMQSQLSKLAGDTK